MACTFCNFISGKRKYHENWGPLHRHNFPVIPIFKTKDVYSFLTVPDNSDETHLLIIPKKHYEFLEDIPLKILNEIMSEIKKAAKILRKKYGACHILLNNGKGAHQYVPHAHFHIIPRDNNKKLIWKNLSVKEFTRISKELKKEFS